MQHGKGTNNFRNRHYPPLPIYGTFRHSPLTIRIILFLLTKHPTKIIVLWLNDERSALPTHYKKLPVAPEQSAMSSQFRFTKLIGYTCEKRETDEQVLSSSFPSEQEQIPTFRTLNCTFPRKTYTLLYKDASISQQRVPSAQQRYIPFARDVYTYRSKPIYLSFETYIPLGREVANRRGSRSERYECIAILCALIVGRSFG